MKDKYLEIIYWKSKRVEKIQFLNARYFDQKYALTVSNCKLQCQQFILILNYSLWKTLNGSTEYLYFL